VLDATCVYPKGVESETAWRRTCCSGLIDLTRSTCWCAGARRGREAAVLRAVARQHRPHDEVLCSRRRQVAAALREDLWSHALFVGVVATQLADAAGHAQLGVGSGTQTNRSCVSAADRAADLPQGLPSRPQSH